MCSHLIRIVEVDEQNARVVLQVRLPLGGLGLLEHHGEELSEELLHDGADAVVHTVLVLLDRLVLQVVEQNVERSLLAALNPENEEFR